MIKYTTEIHKIKEDSRYITRHIMYPTIAVISGGFDPLHVGHMRYIHWAWEHSNILIAIVNGDSFLKRKKGYVFMKGEERAEMISLLKDDILVLLYESEEDTVIKPLEIIQPTHFYKGGDRTGPENIPEWETCEKLHIKVVTGVGGEKIQSSSDLVRRVA